MFISLLSITCRNCSFCLVMFYCTHYFCVEFIMMVVAVLEVLAF